jgi:hypothetical protein
MKFDIERLAHLAGLGGRSGTLLSEGGNLSKREDPSGPPLKSDKKGVSYDGYTLAEAAEEEQEGMEDEEMDPIMEARLKHIIQMEVESMLASRNSAASKPARGITTGFVGPGFRR